MHLGDVGGAARETWLGGVVLQPDHDVSSRTQPQPGTGTAGGPLSTGTKPLLGEAVGLVHQASPGGVVLRCCVCGGNGTFWILWLQGQKISIGNDLLMASQILSNFFN